MDLFLNPQYKRKLSHYIHRLFKQDALILSWCYYFRQKRIPIWIFKKMKKLKKALAAMAAAWTVVLLLVVLGIVINGLNGEEKELQLVHVVMRHGIRTPADTYPNDPHINETYYPVGWGQITTEGKLQLYQVGEYLRNRYNKFLGSKFSPDIYYAQSTGVDRTIVSLQMVNAGLWPPRGDEKWGPLDWQPIPVHFEPLNEDMLLLVRKPCPKYHQEREKVVESEAVQNKLKEDEELFKYMTEHTGKEVKDFDDVQDVFSTLKAEKGFNLTLPAWTEGYYPEKMLEPTVFSYIVNAYNDHMNRLKGGVLLKKILSDWEKKASENLNPEERKAFLYGGHDSTIVNLMRTLKVWDPQLPDYAITILLELYKDKSTNEFGVEVFLRNSTHVPPFKLTIPGCESFCPLSKLKELTESVIPLNWEEECKGDDPNYVVPELGGP